MEQSPIKRIWETDLSRTGMRGLRAGWEQGPVRDAVRFVKRDGGPPPGKMKVHLFIYLCLHGMWDLSFQP